MHLHSLDGEWAVKGITETTDIGELTKLAVKLNMNAVVKPDGTTSHQVRFQRIEEEFGDQEVTNFFILWCYVSGLSGKDGLAKLEQALLRRHFPLDATIQDTMQIGGGPNHEGHEH